MADRITNLEEQLAQQQRILYDLNGVVTGLRTEVDSLTSELTRLKQTAARLLEFHEGAEDAPDEKPPHY